ncbi:acyl-CoA dehydrogenase family protein [Aquisediminimonas sediminicola]|uniref:acyl-CoA dehydrogenase family protein n=1 Tax=Alteraquisediminimonas sediminicola TaxID=2676787 RepID=UPI001C8D3506
MNFDLSEDEEMLKAVAERFVTDHYDLERRRGYLAHPQGFSPENWALMGELGLIAAPFAEDNGGIGVGRTGMITIFEALGRGLVVEPLAESVVLAGSLFERSAPDDLKAAWIESLVMGERRLAVAHAEANARDNANWVETTAQIIDGNAILNGEKSAVIAAIGADAYLVSARISGTPFDPAGIALFLVEADTPGLSVTSWRTVDGSVAGILTLDNVSVPPAHFLNGGAQALASAQLDASLVRSAEMLGIMERIFAETQDYLRTRKQFGKPLASFQALQHRMVAQYSALEQSRSLLYFAAMTDPLDLASSQKAIDGARAFIAQAAVPLGHEMMQLHGGMGVTDELIIGHGHKRLLMLSRWPESPIATLDRHAA